MRIYLYSASGAGSSTLGKLLADSLSYKYQDIDDILFLDTEIPYTIRREKADRIKVFKELLEEDNIVVSGWFSDGMFDFVNHFDYVLFITADKRDRIERITLRELNKWNTRVMPGGDMYDNFLEFIKWSDDYDEADISVRSLAMHLDFYNKIKNKKTIIHNDNIKEAYLEVLKFINF